MKNLYNFPPIILCGKMMDKGLREEIINKKAYLEDLDPSRISLNSEFWKAIEEEALIHSFRIELPKARISTKKASQQSRANYKKVYDAGVECMRNAWLWAKQLYLQQGLFDQELIIGIAERIEPEIVLGYRHDQVRILGSYNLPPRPEKVPWEIEKLIQQTLTISTLEKALRVHFEIARIHPFPDANGRTARMVQNLILAQEGLPPVVIYEGERAHYQDLIGGAVHGYSLKEEKGKPSDEEKTFYTFLAGKVNICLDKLIDHLEK